MPLGRTIAACAVPVLLSVTSAPLLRARSSVQPGGPPYPPTESMRTMQVEDGFRVELVASEPDVQSPVGMDIDEDGRLFVVEMPGYPLDVSPTGTVKLLEDRDGDGRYERVSVFADGLVLPTGVMRWGQGILVTAAPDVLYFEDTDGDGRADVRRVLLTGFARSNPQHTVNSPIYGLDNWVYVAHQGPATAIIYTDLFGDRGTPLRFPDRPGQAPVDPGDSTVRFRPDTFQVEAIAGESQYGHAFDAYGRYFGNDNSHHLWHEVVGARYLRRNPHLLVRGVMHDVPDHGAAAQVFSITQRPNFELLTEAGEFTSACAPTIYLGGEFGGEHEGSVFVAEPVHNLVHRDVLSAAGATFTARRGQPDREFLAAGDAWFRPVSLYVGPDGALYVVDYYRARIEHPEWTSSETQRDPRSMYQGQDRGRIYRIVRTSADALHRPRPALGSASTAQLVEALADTNAWWRRTAQRLLVARADRTAVPALIELAAHGRRAEGRLHALWTLEGLGALDVSVIERALGDPEPGVRENAVLLAELNGTLPALDERLAGLVSDVDARVRFQVLATLGGLDSTVATAAHQRLLFSALDDPWMQIAGLSAGSDRSARYFERATMGPDAITSRETGGRARFIRQVASVIGARGEGTEIQAVIRSVAGGAAGGAAPGRDEVDSQRGVGAASVPAQRGQAPAIREGANPLGGASSLDGAWWRAAALEGLADAARGRPTARASMDSSRGRLLDLAQSLSPAVRQGALRLLGIAGLGSTDAARGALARAERLAASPSADTAERADAVALLALDRDAGRTALLQRLVDPREPEAVQAAAVRALGLRPGRPIGTFLVSHWGQFTPAVRAEAAGALLNDASRTWMLIEAIKTGVVQPWTLDFHQKRRLIMNRNEEVRAAARSLLEGDPRQRGQTVQRYAAALDLAGDPARGEEVFARACAACHAVGGKGGDLGPDLATVRHRPPLLLLADILLPSQSIAQKYETYEIERRSGVTETGVLASQTPTSVTLRLAAAQVTIPRTEIRRMSVAPQSTMPADLDKLIAPEEMADLLAFLRR